MKNSEFSNFGHFDFMKMSPIMGGVSLLMLVLSIAVISAKGFNYGIDFSGGTEMQLKFNSAPDVEGIRKKLTDIGVQGASVQLFGTENEVLIRMLQAEGADTTEINKNSQTRMSKITESMAQDMGLSSDGLRRVDSVGPQVGQELKTQALLSIFYSLMVILIYIGLRFDFRYSPGAVICLFHDTIVVLGIFSLFGREINLQVLAGILTLIGYSLNDTIIVFDAIRSNEPIYKEKGLDFVINKSTNQMLVRTILTAGTTLLSCAFLYFIGTGVIKDIAFTLGVGIILGTYSSIYVASPLIPLTEKFLKKVSV